MKTGLVLDMMADILPDVSEIVNDEELRKIRKTIADEPLRKSMDTLVPFFLTRHKEAMERIIAAAEGKTVEEIREMNVSELEMTKAGELCDDVSAFFGLCLHMALM